jgi:hypothetical protein
VDVTLFDHHPACAFQAIGTFDDLIQHPEVATRLDGVEDLGSQPLSSVHPNIIACVPPIRYRGEIVRRRAVDAMFAN